MSLPPHVRLERAIKSLDQASITSPSVDDVRQLAPQLSKAAAQELIETATSKRTATFYGPPTVAAVAHSYKIRRMPGGVSVLHRAGVVPPTSMVDEAPAAALTYAKSRWELQPTCWDLPLYFIVLQKEGTVVSPRLSVVGGIPSGHALVSLAQSMSPPTDIRPVFEQIDAVLHVLTTSAIQADELSAGALPLYLYYCGECSYAINEIGRCPLRDGVSPWRSARPLTAESRGPPGGHVCFPLQPLGGAGPRLHGLGSACLAGYARSTTTDRACKSTPACDFDRHWLRRDECSFVDWRLRIGASLLNRFVTSVQA
jgi:hypothetical protein